MSEKITINTHKSEKHKISEISVINDYTITKTVKTGFPFINAMHQKDFFIREEYEEIKRMAREMYRKYSVCVEDAMEIIILESIRNYIKLSKNKDFKLPNSEVL